MIRGKRAPGRWVVDTNNSFGIVVNADTGDKTPAFVARTLTEADAHFIATAPELLETLELMVGLVNELAEYDPMLLPTYAKAVTTITKAKGE